MIWRAKYIVSSKMHILVFLEHSKCNPMQYHGYFRQIGFCVTVSAIYLGLPIVLRIK
jgi:hypothetical protein